MGYIAVSTIKSLISDPPSPGKKSQRKYTVLWQILTEQLSQRLNEIKMCWVDWVAKILNLFRN